MGIQLHYISYFPMNADILAQPLNKSSQKYTQQVSKYVILHWKGNCSFSLLSHQNLLTNATLWVLLAKESLKHIYNYTLLKHADTYLGFFTQSEA